MSESYIPGVTFNTSTECSVIVTLALLNASIVSGRSLEEGITAHSSALAWGAFPWTEEPGGLQSRGHKE